MLNEHFGAQRGICHLERHPWKHSTSSSMEELELVLDDGETLRLLFKDLSRGRLLADARNCRPSFLYDPLREITVYREILRHVDLDTATCYGSIVDEAGDRFWIFLEKVPGIRLNKVGEFGVWQTIAARLARMHSRLFDRVPHLDREQPLVRYDATFYHRWPERAIQFSLPGSRSDLERIAAGYASIVQELLRSPLTIVHGDFFPFNVLVDRRSDRDLRMRTIDWETAGIGPALVDLAALIAGSWGEEEKRALVESYRRAIDPEIVIVPAGEAFDRLLDACRLHVCLQWLGYAPEWTERHGEAWFAEALPIAERLGLLR